MFGSNTSLHYNARIIYYFLNECHFLNICFALPHNQSVILYSSVLKCLVKWEPHVTFPIKMKVDETFLLSPLK